MKNTALTKLRKDESNPRKPDVARLGLLRLSLSKLGFTHAVKSLPMQLIGLHTLFSRKCVLVEESSCIEWRGRTNRDGYGRVVYEGRDWLVHRLSYALYSGNFVLSGLVVRHSCDNPSCVNPEHLSLGTQKDNVEDAASRGRMPRGERHHSSRITEADVRHIRRSNAKHTTLAEAYGVHPVTILDIRASRTWSHVK